MRPRTIILALAGLLFINALIVLGVWLWFRVNSPSVPVAQTTNDEPGVVIESATAEPNQTSPAPSRSPIIPVTEPMTAGPAWAAFDTPQENEAVPRTFRATGRCGALPAGSQLVLAVQTGRVVSPKYPPLVIDGENWSGTCREYGAPVGGAFTLCIFVVSDEGLQEIAQWHVQGKATGKYPPFRAVPGGVSLAKVKLTVRR